LAGWSNALADPAIRRAEALASRLPPLLVAAERVAATVAQGVHGRRRVGQGDSFWQFRRFVAGDPINRVDWRQSAKSGQSAPHGWFVRETEWEAAQTVCLWRDSSPSMHWRRGGSVDKYERATLLTLALAALLLRGGERILPMMPGARPVAGRFGLERFAADLASGTDDAGLPPDMAIPRHATAVLIGDFLSPLADIQATVGRLAATPVRGFLLQVLDPAEAALPYQGRVRFRGLENDGEALIPRVESIRDDYAHALQAQQAGLSAICAAAGFGFGVHLTDRSPEAALLSLYTALGPV
jgi:uncharacterized protein (DUF58 family)